MIIQDCESFVAESEKNMDDERIMNLIVDIYNQMDEDDKTSFTLEEAENMVKDQIEIDFSHGREPLDYDPQLFYEVIREFIQQDAEEED